MDLCFLLTLIEEGIVKRFMMVLLLWLFNFLKILFAKLPNRIFFLMWLPLATIERSKLYKLKFRLSCTNERFGARRNSRLELKYKKNGNSI